MSDYAGLCKNGNNYAELCLIVPICSELFRVGKTGFEPATTRPPALCATGLRYFPKKNLF